MLLILRWFSPFALAIFAVLFAWDAYTQHRWPNTSRDLRFFGYGSTPAVCMDRLQRNLPPIQASLDEVVEVFEADPDLARAYISGSEPRDLGIEKFTGELAETPDGISYSVRDSLVIDPPEAENHPLWSPLVKLAESGSAVRPFSFSRSERGGAISARGWFVCGGPAWRQPFLYIQPTPSLAFPPQKEGHLTGYFTYRYGPAEIELSVCDGQVTLDERFLYRCEAPLTDGWFVVQYWEDTCALLNAQGFPEPGDRGYSARDEETWAELRANGVTPCEYFGHR